MNKGRYSVLSGFKDGFRLTAYTRRINVLYTYRLTSRNGWGNIWLELGDSNNKHRSTNILFDKV